MSTNRQVQVPEIGRNASERLGNTPSCLVHIECNSGTDMLEWTHAFFTSYCEGQFRPQVAQKLTAAAFVLLENGLNYGAITQKVVIELLQGNGWHMIRVSNVAIPARISILLEHLEKLRVNPEVIFMEEMRKSMGGMGQRAMLGLARLAHESQLELVAHAEDKHVIVEAYCRD
jgi:hypothetical protein